jgi:cell division septum initiation protein DivIVA
MAEKPGLTPDEATAFSDTLFDKILACAETVQQLNQKIERLNQKIDKLRSSKIGTTFTKATIMILADKDGPTQLRLIYRETDGI